VIARSAATTQSRAACSVPAAPGLLRRAFALLAMTMERVGITFLPSLLCHRGENSRLLCATAGTSTEPQSEEAAREAGAQTGRSPSSSHRNAQNPFVTVR